MFLYADLLHTGKHSDRHLLQGVTKECMHTVQQSKDCSMVLVFLRVKLVFLIVGELDQRREVI